MTVLVLSVLGVLVVGASGSWVGGRLRRRHGARRQRRALDRLGSISGQDRPTAPTPRLPPGPSPQAHVKLVGPGDDRPDLMPRPLASGWRPARATGAAPFRSPLPQGARGETHGRWPLVPAGDDLPGVDTWGDDVGSVRVVRPDPDPGGTDPSDPSVAKDPAAADTGGLLTGQPVGAGFAGSGPAPASPRPQAAPTDPAQRTAPGAASIVFDDLSAGDPPEPPPPVEPVVAGGRDPDQRSRWAAQLASVRARQHGTGSHRGPVHLRTGRASPKGSPLRRGPSRRRVPRHRTLGVSAVVVVLAAAAFGAVAGETGHHPGGRLSAAAGQSPEHGSTGTKAHRTSPTSTVPSPSSGTSPSSSPSGTSGAQPVTVRLLSSSAGASVYQVAKSAPITLSLSGRCWVEVRSGGASGPVTHEATMPAGTTLRLSGPVWIRLGNPAAVGITVGSTTVTPPWNTGGAYDLELRSAS